MTPLYLVDFSIIDDIILQNTINLFKLLILSILVFYILPIKLFPQPIKKLSIEKIVVNFIFMVSFIELFVPALVFLKIFSIPMFLVLLVLTKLFFIHFFYKIGIYNYFEEKKSSFMVVILDFLDEPRLFYISFSEYMKQKAIDFQTHITFHNVARFFIYSSVFIYIIIGLSLRGLESLSDPLPDTAQFIDWVAHLQKNVLFSDGQTGADFYGIAILIFFINIFTNIEPLILFSVYPVLLILALYFSIFFVIKDFTKSGYVAIFGVMIHGILLMSPLVGHILGTIATTLNPQIFHIFGLSFYTPTQEEILSAVEFEFESYQRYISAMAYEHASVFVLLNSYFLIKIFQLKKDIYFILYALTLFLVFTFHGGGAIPLIVVSILIAFNAILFRQIDFKILKKGLSAILVASILGNLWILSVVKYGIPDDFGAAAPFLDKFFHTKQNIVATIEKGFSNTSFIIINDFHYILFSIFVFSFIFALFSKDRFFKISFLLIPLGIFIIYFGPTAGLPTVASFLRLSEYLLISVTLLFSYVFYLFYTKIPKLVILIIIYIIFFFSILAIPKWMGSQRDIQLLNFNEWTSIPESIVKIDKINQKFTWTFISYVQDYPKMKDKSYHINTEDFLFKYSPISKFLEIPTKKVFIVVEDFSNPYMGLNEWFYRWKYLIENDLKSWIANYTLAHDNIKIFYRTKLITVYEIDNQEYMNYLEEKAREHRRK